MADDRYNGWANYETWCVKLWMDNDEGSYRYWKSETLDAWEEAEADKYFTRKERAAFGLADRLKNEFGDNHPLTDQANVYADLLGAALSEVNWDEIANSLLNDYEDDLEEEEDEDEVDS